MQRQGWKGLFLHRMWRGGRGGVDVMAWQGRAATFLTSRCETTMAGGKSHSRGGL